MNYLVETNSPGMLERTADKLCPKATKVFLERGEEKVAIDDIRKLKKELALKKTTETAILIENAERLTTPAQNAFLKLLEEPPANVCFFLASRSADNLLPTIVSRCAIVRTKERERRVGMTGEQEMKAKLLLQTLQGGRSESLPAILAYKNEIKKELKDYQRARDYLSVWIMLLRDAVLLKTGNQGNLSFPQEREKIIRLSANASLENLTNTIRLGAKLIAWLETKSVGGVRAGGVFLSRVSLLLGGRRGRHSRQGNLN